MLWRLLEFSWDQTMDYSSVSRWEAYFSSDVWHFMPSRMRSIFYASTINLQKTSMNFKRCKLFCMIKFNYKSLLNTQLKIDCTQMNYSRSSNTEPQQTLKNQNSPKATLQSQIIKTSPVLEVLERLIDVKYLYRRWCKGMKLVQGNHSYELEYFMLSLTVKVDI